MTPFIYVVALSVLRLGSSGQIAKIQKIIMYNSYLPVHSSNWEQTFISLSIYKMDLLEKVQKSE